MTIYHGLVLADDTVEYLPMFTGIIQDDPSFDSTSGFARFSLLEKSAALLEQGRASNVCVTGTAAATSPTNGNGVIETFSAVLMSIWEITNVTWNSIVREQGTDYTLDNLNDAEVAADINFETASVPGAFPITFNYKQWYRNKSVKELVDLLCEEAGIGAGDRDVDDVIFPGGSAGSKTIDTQANWEAGTVETNNDTTSLPGDIRKRWHVIDLFDDLDYTASPAWAAASFGTSSSAATGALVLTASPSEARTMALPLDRQTGTWCFRAKATTADGHIVLSRTSSAVATGHDTDATGIRLRASIGNELNFGTFKAGSASAQRSGAVTVGSYHEYRITRNAAGTVECFVDGVSLGGEIVGYDTSVFTHIVLWVNATGTMEFDDFYYSESIDGSTAVSSATMVWESAVQDLIAAPTTWGFLERTETLNGGTILYETASSTDGVSWDAYVPISGTGLILSALKRYLKIRVTMTPLSASYVSPVLSKLIARFMTDNLFILSADFTGQTCYQAIQGLAELGGMEFGPNGDGTFYFRNKTVTGGADIVLSQRNAVSKVTKYATGYKDVRPIAVVRYGKSGTDGYYNAEYSAAQSGEASPTTAQRFGDKTIELDLNRFIFANSADVANAIAQKLYELNYRPKRKLTLECRLIAHLDSSDKASISFHDSPLIEKAIYGDPFQKYPVTGANARTLARSIMMKVVGHAPDIIKAKSIVDLEEILS